MRRPAVRAGTNGPGAGGRRSRRRRSVHRPRCRGANRRARAAGGSSSCPASGMRSTRWGRTRVVGAVGGRSTPEASSTTRVGREASWTRAVVPPPGERSPGPGVHHHHGPELADERLFGLDLARRRARRSVARAGACVQRRRANDRRPAWRCTWATIRSAAASPLSAAGADGRRRRGTRTADGCRAACRPSRRSRTRPLRTRWSRLGSVATSHARSATTWRRRRVASGATASAAASTTSAWPPAALPVSTTTTSSNVDVPTRSLVARARLGQRGDDRVGVTGTSFARPRTRPAPAPT